MRDEGGTLHPSSFRLHPCFLRDGVTGSTSGFEPEDEGSTPSPGATDQDTGRRGDGETRGRGEAPCHPLFSISHRVGMQSL